MSEFIKAVEAIDYECAFLVDPENKLDLEELAVERLRVWQWADRELGNAWTKAHERFRQAIADPSSAVVSFETALYRETCIDLVRLYRERHERRKAIDFLAKAKARAEQPKEVQQSLFNREG